MLLLKELIIRVEYDSILVIIERLTKYIILIPYREASIAKELAYTFIKYIVTNYRVLEEIISDRDKLFTSKF